MMALQIPSRLVHETFGRLRGLRALLRSMELGFPEAAWREEKSLHQQVEEGFLQEADFHVESQLNVERFRFWAPRYAGYSGVILAHSLVESQLFECVAALRRPDGGVVRGKRRGIDRARAQLRLLANSDVSADLAWPELVDLEKMRNLIVHGGGVPVPDTGIRWLSELSTRHPGRIWIADDLYWYHRHLVVTLPCAAEFVELADGFFRRVFPALGFSVEGVRFVK